MQYKVDDDEVPKKVSPKMFSNKVAPLNTENEAQVPLTSFELKETDSSENEKNNNKDAKKAWDDHVRKRLVKIAVIAVIILIIILLAVVTPAVLLSKRKGSKPVKPTQSVSTIKPTTTQSSLQCIKLDYKVSNGDLKCSGHAVGDTCSVSCSYGFALAKATGHHSCVGLKSGLAWSGVKGLCQPKPCSTLPPVSNVALQKWVCSNGLEVGSSCEVSCQKNGFKSFNSKTTCLIGDRWASGWTECVALDLCSTGLHNCSSFADCQNGAASSFSCTCRIGYAGNGFHCANDTDSDGIPDAQLQCASKSCQKDNCIFIPNSGQEDLDKDKIGNACDNDDDNDGITDKTDNCPLVSNPLQNDTDSDGIGDACDNCRNANNTDQMDTNSNGIGDACEIDADGDGLNNTIDNCPLVYNPDQSDVDGDGVGDACDNCLNVKNNLQTDENDDLIGDACEYKIDSDSDGFTDNIDNCIFKPNGDQTDTDRDGIGDQCDIDKDNDGILNTKDNCPLVYNPDQADADKNDIGDACENDDDGDSVSNKKDDFPLNANKSQTDFRRFNKIIFDDKGVDQPAPKWFLFDEGKEALQTVNGNPGALIGNTYFGRLVYTGTLMVRSPEYGKGPDDDYVGIIFGFQSNRNFYICSWKKIKQSYSIKGSVLPYPRAYGRQGISLKKFHSATGPGEAMRDALWETGNTIDQSTLLWHDQNPAWQFNVSYQWNLVHDPDSGRIRIQWYQGKNLISDSGDIIDKTWRGGRVGVYVFSQENVYFSAMRTKSPKMSDFSLEFNGESSYVDLGEWSKILDGSSSFMMDLWVFMDGTSNITCEVVEKIDFGNGGTPEPKFLTQDTTDELDWDFSNTTTPSAQTGPSFDHTTENGTGYYSFFNSMWDFRAPKIGYRARLLTPWFPATNSCSLDLFLHMWDGTAVGTKTKMGSFQIDVRNTEGAWNQVLWVKGNQNNTWHRKSIVLKPNIKSYEDIQVRLTAVRGSRSQSDIAMDDLTFGNGCGLKTKETCEDNRNYIIGSSSSSHGPYLFVNRGELIGGITENETLSTNISDFNYGSWNHVALSFNDTTKNLAIYLNGNEAASRTLEHVDNWDRNNLLIGRSGNYRMKGIVDEIRIWKSVMNITNLYRQKTLVSQERLIAQYSLNEGEGTSANDSTSRQSRAKIHNADWVRSFVPR